MSIKAALVLLVSPVTPSDVRNSLNIATVTLVVWKCGSWKMRILIKLRLWQCVTLLVETAEMIWSRLTDTFGTLALGPPLVDEATRFAEVVSYEHTTDHPVLSLTLKISKHTWPKIPIKSSTIGWILPSWKSMSGIVVSSITSPSCSKTKASKLA